MRIIEFGSAMKLRENMTTVIPGTVHSLRAVFLADPQLFIRLVTLFVTASSGKKVMLKMSSDKNATKTGELTESQSLSAVNSLSCETIMHVDMM